MPRFSWRGLNVPPEHHAFETKLSDAKCHAWAAFVGERRPAAWPPAPRRRHSGLLDDLPFPEGPIRRRQAALPAVLRAVVRALGTGGHTAASLPAEWPAGAGGCIADGGIGQSGAPEAVTRPPAAVSLRRRLPTAA